MKKKYTVLLLYPDNIASDFGSETFLAHVTSGDAHCAVIAARAQVAEEFDQEDRDNTDFDDFYCLAVFEGHLEALCATILEALCATI